MPGNQCSIALSLGKKGSVKAHAQRAYIEYQCLYLVRRFSRCSTQHNTEDIGECLAYVLQLTSSNGSSGLHGNGVMVTGSEHVLGVIGIPKE